uniref:Uncharacterized protein n=1 Tax=Trichogramma kaykai TaxID=54128 RepID=A0ABD2XCD5_9HYME
MKSYHPRVISLLLRNGADPNLANKDGSTPVHVVCQERFEIDLFGIFFMDTLYMNQEVRVDARDNLGRAPLHLALEHDLKSTAEDLLWSGADPNLANVEGWTPLHIVCKRKERCPDENLNLATMLMESSRDEDDVPQLLIDARNEASCDTALHLAAGNKNRDLFVLLLTRGADPNSANAEGLTPLHVICKDSYCCL